MGGEKSLVDFLVEISFSLMHGTSSTTDSEYDVCTEVYRSMRSADIPREMPYDKFNQWTVLFDTPNSQRCKYKHCNKKTKYQWISMHKMSGLPVLQIIVVSERSME